MTPDDVARGIDDQDALYPIEADDCTCDHLKCLENSIFFGIDCPCPCHPTDIKESIEHGIDDSDDLTRDDCEAVDVEISFPKDQSRMFSVEDAMQWVRQGGWDIGQFQQDKLEIVGDKAVIKGKLEVPPMLLIQMYGKGYCDFVKGDMLIRMWHYDHANWARDLGDF